MTEPTTAEEHQAGCECCQERLHPCDVYEGLLRADVERLTADARRNSELGKAELATLRDQHKRTKAEVEKVQHDFETAETAWDKERAALEAQREEVVRLLSHDVLPRLDGWNDPLELCRQRVAAFLASLSTVTPDDWAGHQRERALGADKTEAELREKYGLEQACELVTTCCGEADRFTLEGECSCGRPDGIEGYKCATHGIPWPDEGVCPAVR